jgi:hypothetical protein
MTGNPSAEPEDWTEVGILPSDPAQQDPLLLDVIDPLINDTLSERIESWHFFWEVDPLYWKDDPAPMRHLRLRVLWRPGQGEAGRAELTRYLDEAETAGGLWRWYPSNNGIPGEEYEGEAAGYDGPEMWRVTYRDWRAGSDLSLALVKLEDAGRLAKGRQYHLERRVHLHSNRLGLSYRDEGTLYLGLAIGYMELAGLSGDGMDTLRGLKDSLDKLPPVP